MDGRQYIATTDVFNAADERIAAAGDRCGAVSPTSLPWLLEQGYIVPADETSPGRPATDERSDE